MAKTDINDPQGWWDRDSDDNANPIREDVRSTAREIWREVYERVRKRLRDDSDAGTIMEVAVGRVSQELEAEGAPADTDSGHRDRLWKAIYATIDHYTQRRRREARGLRALEKHLTKSMLPSSPEDRLTDHLYFQEFREQLTGIDAMIIVLRAGGYDWNEVARKLNIPVSTAKTRERRAIEREKQRTMNHDRDRGRRK